MKTRESARKLAKMLIQVSKKLGLPCRAVLTNMDQPLGYAVGNSLEVIECIEVLRGFPVTDGRRVNGVFTEYSDLTSADLKELTIQLCAHMLELGGTVKNLIEGRKLAHSKILDGSAWKVFQELVKQQSGSTDTIDNPRKLPCSPRKTTLRAKKRGYLTQIDTSAIGQILIELGGGRKKASDLIDPSVGLIFHKKLGSKIVSGDAIATVFVPALASSDSSKKSFLSELETFFHDSIEITGARKPVPKLIYEVLS